MLLHLNTRYNTTLTLDSDNIHNLCEALEDIRQLVNLDSYVGFNNYLNNNCEDCVGSVRTQDNVIIYVLEGIIHGMEQRYNIQAVEHEEGVSMSIHTKDKSEFIYNRMTKAVS